MPESLTPSRIVLSHSFVPDAKPDPDSLMNGEIALNATDDIIFYKNSDGDLVEKSLRVDENIIGVVNDNFANKLLNDVDIVDDQLILTFQDTSTKNLGNVRGPQGKGIGFDGVVNYADELPLPAPDHTPNGRTLLPDILNKSGTAFIVLLGEDENNLFGDDVGRVYVYDQSITDPLLRWSNTGVLQGPAGPNSVTSLTDSDGTATLLIDSVETIHAQFADTVTFNNTIFSYGEGAAVAQRTALGLGSAATEESTAFATATHNHGNITFDGKIGTTSGYIIITGSGGLLNAVSLNTINFPNADVTAATANATINTLAKRNGTGGISFSNLSIDQGTITLSRQFDYEGQAANSTIILDRQNGSTADHVEGTNTITFPLQNGTVALLENSVQYRLNTSPNQLAPEDNGIAMLLQYGDSVWFKDTNDVSILLAGSGNQEGDAVITNVSLNSDSSVTSLGTFPAAGQYRVRLDNFSSTNYVGSGDGFGISRYIIDFPTGAFSNIIIDNYDGTFLTSNNSSLNSEGSLVLDVTQNNEDWPAPNGMFIDFLVTVDTSFDWQGFDFVQEIENGMNVDFTVTITPESYTPPPTVYTLTETLVAGTVPTNSVTVPVGEYVVNISVSDINMSTWGSNFIYLQSSESNSLFSSPNVNTLAAIEIIASNTVVEFSVGDPTIEPNQNGNLIVNNGALTTFSFGEIFYLPNEGDSLTVTVTFE